MITYQFVVISLQVQSVFYGTSSDVCILDKKYEYYFWPLLGRGSCPLLPIPGAPLETGEVNRKGGERREGTGFICWRFEFDPCTKWLTLL